jgi:hypothetical protein
MWVETYHIFVVVTSVKVNCTPMDMGNYTFTRNISVLDRRTARDLAKRHSRHGAVKGSSDFREI